MLAAVLVAGVASPAAGDPITDLRRRLETAREHATEAAARHADALAEQARLQVEIARLEAEIPRLRAEAETLRQRIRRRAAELYKMQSREALVDVVTADDVIAAARRTRLTSAVTSHENDTAAELRRTEERLRRTEEDLRARQAEQDVLVAQLELLRRLLDFQLALAGAALEQLREIRASQAREAAAGTEGAAAGQVATGALRCPVDGAVAFTNDWGQPRSEDRTHEGTDLVASRGTPNVAVVDGVVEHRTGGNGGLAVWLRGDDGVSYYYAHLDRFEGPPRLVKLGDVVGYTGDTGNAAGGPPHTHFEIHPGGHGAVNPYPTLRVLCRAPDDRPR